MRASALSLLMLSMLAGCADMPVVANDTAAGDAGTATDGHVMPTPDSGRDAAARDALVPDDTFFDADAFVDVDAFAPMDAFVADAGNDARADDATSTDAATMPDAPDACARCGTICVDLASEPANCGTCGHDCRALAPTGASGVSCASSACVFTCPSGTAVLAGACAPIAAPRPISPLSTGSASSRRPLFTWALAAGSDGAHVEICSDRACTTSITAFDASGASGRPAVTLPHGVVFWRLHGRGMGNTGSAVSPTWQLAIPTRDAPRDAWWGSTFDANGDGYGDVVTSGNGTVYVYQGGSSGPGASPDTSFDGSATNVAFGALASAGDIDGDGFSDLIVAAENNADRHDYVYLLRGGASGLATTAAWTIADPHVMNEGFGASIAFAGDVDADGYADIVVGSWTGAGHAWIFRGSPSGPIAASAVQLTIAGAASNTHFGASVAGGFDLDGDGRHEVLVGAPGESMGGNAYVIDAAGVRVATLSAGSSQGQYGASVANGGDVDGNGYADAVVGAPGVGGGQGFVLVYSARAADFSSTVAATSGFGSLGLVVAGAGDVNGDGYDDVIAGAPYDNSSDGKLVVMRGSATGAMTTSDITGVTYDSFGRTNWATGIAGVGDTNGDGLADIAVGTPNEYAFRGVVDVFRGNAATTFEPLTRPQIMGGGGGFGRVIAGRD